MMLVQPAAAAAVVLVWWCDVPIKIKIYKYLCRMLQCCCAVLCMQLGCCRRPIEAVAGTDKDIADQATWARSQG